ncbi:MAG: hypothetical protein AAGE88_12880 [Actinomycetota bacterium]
MNVVVQLFRLSPSSWAALGPIGLPRAALTAVGAWTLLAWGRLGLQAVTAPRATVRFVLIGAYAWLALAALVWLVVVLAERLATSVDPAPAPAPTIDGLLRITEVVGSAHRPLVFLGIAIQLLQLVNLLGGPGAVFAAVTMAWMAATLGAAVAWAARRPLLVGLAVTVLPFALWLATAGRFGLNRVGHLL